METKGRTLHIVELGAGNDLEFEFLRRQLEINKHDLDRCLVEHPNYLQKVCEHCAIAMSVRDQLKESLKQVEAKLYLGVRAKLESEGSKPTETKINSTVQIHDDRKSASARYFDASEAAEVWQSLKDSFIQRGFVLKDLSSLWQAEYYTSNSVSGLSDRDTQEKRNMEMRSQIREKARGLERERLTTGDK